MKDIFSRTNKIIKEKNVPINVVVELTRRCNLDCLHCYNFKDDSELDFYQMKHIFNELRAAGCLFLTFTGGEVFIKEDFLDILGLARHLGFDVEIITNATLINEKTADELKSLCLSNIGISIYATSSSIHDKITGVKGSFYRTMHSIEMLRSKGLNLHLKCTLMKYNFAEYKKIVQLAESLNVNYIIDPIISPKDDGSKDVLSCRLNDSQLKDFYFDLFGQIEYSSDNKSGAVCDAGCTFAAVSAKGDIYPCIQVPVSAGNIFEKNFKNIWTESEVLNKIRIEAKYGPSVCKDCYLRDSCSRCPGLALLEDGDMFGCSRTACSIAKFQKCFKEEKLKNHEEKIGE
ncbi:MAG: radical SAM protein [Candidatus Omnitrophica bacterium]|nr:radical SAM protein [Candidatus Omnitrophota bacterium]